jgi:hypothetical protein
MPKPIPPATPEPNRLRAAAGLIPIIENGLFQKTISAERASIMAAFCAWARDQTCSDASTTELAEIVSSGLERIDAAIERGGTGVG